MAAVGTLVLGSAVAWAATGQRLHEYFDLGLLRGTLGRTTGTGAPEAGSLGAPGTDEASPASTQPWEGLVLEPGPNELVYAQEGPRGWRDLDEPHGSLDPAASAELDDQTDYANPLDYHEVFAPPIAPYKRAMAHNQVERTADGRYRTRLASTQRATLALEPGPARGDEEVFEASMLLRLERGVPVSIPSAAPVQRLLALSADPPVSVRILRDEAGNHWAQAPHDGLVRVQMTVAAPRAYFEGEFDLEAGWSDFPKDFAPPLPVAAREAAMRVVDALRLRAGRRELRPYEALYRLVEHFRNFDAVPLADGDAGTGGRDLYETIATGQAGVCRHRSLAFVVTAQALGIPARYVFNEAHAFVEVFWPRVGWRRIDLGGAMDEVRVRQAAGPALAPPSYHDGLPQPERYREQLRRMAEARQAGEGAGGDAAIPPAASENPGVSGDTAQSPGVSSAATGPGRAEPVAESGAGAAPLGEGLGSDEGGGAGPAPDARVAVSVRLVSASAREVVRGQRLVIHGELTLADGRGLMGLPVRLYLAPPLGRGASHYVNLTEVTTGPAGLFSAEVALRPDLAAGRWIVVAEFAGDQGHRPASSAGP